jgi:alkylhydroperoxidase/carboxymuconolactone decarboxylase family protein YurZ
LILYERNAYNFGNNISHKKYKHVSTVNEFNEYREKMNEVIPGKNNLVMKRLWNLDTNTYEEGALDKKTKEMLGLVASMVLRCDDCINIAWVNRMNRELLQSRCMKFLQWLIL